MAVYIPVFAQEKDIIITITPQDVAADGSLTDNAIGAFQMDGRIEEHDEGGALTVENLSPAGFFQSNPVPFEMGGTARLSEFVLARPNVSSVGKTLKFGNVLRSCQKASFYWKVVIVLYDRVPDAQETATYYFLTTGVVQRTGRKNRVMDEVTVATIILVDSDTGLAIANPAFS